MLEPASAKSALQYANANGLALPRVRMRIRMEWVAERPLSAVCLMAAKPCDAAQLNSTDAACAPAPLAHVPCQLNRHDLYPCTADVCAVFY